MALTRLAMTMGDPAGIGPEIIVKALSGSEFPEARILLVGYRAYLERAAEIFRLKIDEILSGAVEFIEPDFPVGPDIPFGVVMPDGGHAAVRAIITAVQLAKSNDVGGIVTAPINKASLAAAGYKWRGHTEMLRELTGARKVVMMLAGGGLRVALVTTHVRLVEAIQGLKADDIVACAQATSRALQRFFVDGTPRLALAAVNPHASEGGLFGPEEAEILLPAVRELQNRGVEIDGPLSADALFARAVSGPWDAVIAIYHDQGLIPLKLQAGGRAVNITLGLPIIRTSVGHGTAFDIAGTGKADEGSLIEAVKTALLMARKGKQHLADET